MESKDTFFKAFPVVWVVTFVVGILLWVLVSQAWGISFILGSITGLMTMSMLYKNSKIIVQTTNKEVAQKLAVKNYAFRMFFYALILVIAGVLDSLELIGTMIGLFTFKIVFYILIFFEKRGEVT
ncbi:MAG: ATP synthase I chain [Candidatus Izimaplasma bacterium HR2]|nr:MAG: ATP synthase I chain [Candidatus Izimaplasma bacterium HR2]